MAKISIKQNPTFKIDVEIPRIGDKPVKVPFVFAYRDREELAEFADSGLQHGKELRELIEKESTVREISSKSEEFQVKQIELIVKGWGFDDELNEENIRALVRSYAAVPDAIIGAYQESYNKARQGN
ncbi:phage tail assembly chaperone [Pseudomonas sp. A1437]|uniref:phage tail assembly chaperone n=1 Tax=unclassified Pseudomonas TaxID=196821 RepID=UPI003783C063